jgi:hypothetical protein
MRNKAKTNNQQAKEEMPAHLPAILPFAFLLLPLLASCADNHPTTRPSTVEDRQAAALRDPFGYSPFDDKNDKNQVSDPNVSTYDKEGMKRDIDHVLNP